MNALSIIQLVLMLLQGVAASARQQGLLDIANAAARAVTELLKVHDTDVTKGQLDSLRVEPQWQLPPPTTP